MYSTQIKLRSSFDAQNSGITSGVASGTKPRFPQSSLQSSSLNSLSVRRYNMSSPLQARAGSISSAHRLPSSTAFFKGAIKGLEIFGFKKPSSIGASSSLFLFKKLNSLEKKTATIQRKISTELMAWSNDLVGNDCQQIVSEFVDVLNAQIKQREDLLSNADNLCFVLSQISKREAQILSQYEELAREEGMWNKKEGRLGACSETQLMMDNMKSMKASMDTAAANYSQSIRTTLKDALYSYTITLQMSSAEMKAVCDKFFNTLEAANSGENKGDSIPDKFYKAKVESVDIEENSSKEPKQSRNIKDSSFIDVNETAQSYEQASPMRKSKPFDSVFADTLDHSRDILRESNRNINYIPETRNEDYLKDFKPNRGSIGQFTTPGTFSRQASVKRDDRIQGFGI